MKLEKKQIVNIEKALIKKAVGYTAEEMIEEFNFDDGGLAKLSKRKLTQKHVPADIAAAKMLLDMSDTDEYAGMTVTQLIEEKQKYLTELSKIESSTKSNENNE